MVAVEDRSCEPLAAGGLGVGSAAGVVEVEELVAAIGVGGVVVVVLVVVAIVIVVVGGGVVGEVGAKEGVVEPIGCGLEWVVRIGVRFGGGVWGST